jgi:hypothetical protein
LKEVSDGSVYFVKTNNQLRLAASPETIRVTLNRNDRIEQSVNKSARQLNTHNKASEVIWAGNKAG